MARFKDLTGTVHGRWKVLGIAPDGIRSDGHPQKQWYCECQCEKHTKTILPSSQLGKKGSQSCGCLKIEKARLQGLSNTKINQYNLFGDYGIGYTSNTNKPFYFDLEDYDKIKKYCWYENSQHYIASSLKGKKKIIRLHCFVLNFPESEIDHINHDIKDNRKNNLRICSHRENSMNISLRKDNSSGFIGITWRKDRNKWSAGIVIHGKNKALGCYVDKEDAIKARLNAEAKYFKDFAPQKHLFEQYGINVQIESQ